MSDRAEPASSRGVPAPVVTPCREDGAPEEEGRRGLVRRPLHVGGAGPRAS